MNYTKQIDGRTGRMNDFEGRITVAKGDRSAQHKAPEECRESQYLEEWSFRHFNTLLLWVEDWACKECGGPRSATLPCSVSVRRNLEV